MGLQGAVWGEYGFSLSLSFAKGLKDKAVLCSRR